MPKVSRREHRSIWWFGGRLMSIGDQRCVFEPDVTAVIAMVEDLVGPELSDASAVHAPVAQDSSIRSPSPCGAYAGSRGRGLNSTAGARSRCEYVLALE
jgi:hypothetical protein